MTVAQLRALMGQQIGLPASFDGSVAAYRNLTPAQQVELNRACLAYIQQNPDKFSAAQVSVATDEAGRAAGDITDSSFADSLGIFWDEFTTQAENFGDQVGSVGRGLGTTIDLAGKLLPVIALVALVIFALPYVKKATATSPQ